MNTIMGFMTAALPWIALGLWIVTATIQQGNTNKGKKTPLVIKLLALLPAVLFFLLAAIQRGNGETQTASTNTVLAVFIIVYAMYADWKETRKDQDKK